MTQPPKQFDPVGEFLHEQGCPSHVVRAGLKGLVMAWEKVVHELVFDGYRYGLRDFASDLWRRELLEGALRHLEGKPGRTVPEAFRARIGTADKRFQDATRPSSRSLREVVPSPSPDRPAPSTAPSANATSAAGGGSADAPGDAWWFQRLPRRHRANFARDLESAGIQGIDEPATPTKT